MRKFLLGMFCGLVLFCLLAVVVVFALARIGSRKPAVADRATLVLRWSGDMPERAPVDFPLPWLDGASPMTVAETWSMLRRAASDPKIKAISLEPRGIGMGWAKLDEIRGALAQFKKSGKPVYAWLQTPSLKDYYLASVADHIAVSEEDILDVRGIRAEMTYVKGTLDKIGLEMEVEHAGKYKDAGDMFTRTSMSPETRESLGALLDGIYGRLVAGLATARKKSEAEIRDILDQGPYLAPAALKRGIIDAVEYEDQYYDALKKKAGLDEIRKLKPRDYTRSLEVDGKGTRVAFLVGDGAIYRGRGDDSGFDDAGIFSETFIKVIRQVLNDDEIKGVILRVDSPGGDALASDDILRELKLLSSKKPMVVSMSDVAASGGYYIAATGDPILAYPNTITGSIGVIFAKPNLKGTYDKLGLTEDGVQRGKNADFFSLTKPLTPEGRMKLKELVDSTYDGFLTRVADARKLKKEQVHAVAQGRVWLGSAGLEHKLVDHLGGIDKAIEVLRAKANIGKDDRLRLVVYPPKRSFFERFFKSGTSGDAFTDAMLNRKLRALAEANGIPVSVLQSTARGGLMRMMPFTLSLN